MIPILLAVVLVAAYRRNLMGDYRHPWWAGAFGLLAFVIALLVAGLTVYDNLPTIFPGLKE
jgi:Mn2+/Fe2+ NRAMP family transporter